MLQQQDYDMLETMITRVVTTAIKENNEELKTELRSDMKAMEEGIRSDMKDMDKSIRSDLRKEIREAISESESFLLDEMERYYQLTRKDICRIDKKVDEIAEYYRIRRSEDNMCSVLFTLYHQQQSEIDAIKEKIAM